MYKVTVTSEDDKFNVKEKGYLVIYSKKTKTVTVKMNKMKKIKGDIIKTFKQRKKRTVPERSLCGCIQCKKNPLDRVPHSLITKAKFFFKNKKTRKIITKTVKSKYNVKYGWEYPYYKLIKGYTPVKTKIWYTLYK